MMSSRWSYAKVEGSHDGSHTTVAKDDAGSFLHECLVLPDCIHANDLSCGIIAALYGICGVVLVPEHRDIPLYRSAKADGKG